MHSLELVLALVAVDLALDWKTPQPVPVPDSPAHRPPKARSDPAILSSISKTCPGDWSRYKAVRRGNAPGRRAFGVFGWMRGREEEDGERGVSWTWWADSLGDGSPDDRQRNGDYMYRHSLL